MADDRPGLRARLLSRPLLRIARKAMPHMSETERVAIAAGTVWWEAQLFARAPDWKILRQFPAPRLSTEEQAFLDGPVERLCEMLDDWQIRHELGDLPDNVWRFIRDNRFFGIIIPKEYGGLGFSALAHSAIVLKIASRSSAAAVTVMVPNSLGPAELLLRYGSEEQKSHYLPRLAKGIEIPCFGLTAPEAGSDAAAIPDTGVVTHGEYQGQRTLGIRLDWDKRYITLGPVATLIGLAFKLRDPEKLLGGKEEPGITLALIPAKTPGIEIGRRHYPAGQAFQNGPNRGRDVFIPFDYVVGGKKGIGEGWRMLMDCLAAGRAISLPALSASAAQFCARNTGAYARIRRQFGVPIGTFEGIEEALARIAVDAYVLEAGRRLTAAAIDAGEQPSVLSAILKYHATERMRRSINDAMDIHGGRAVCDGPRNYLNGVYQSIPVAITVEGANILTRSLIIFGQGAIRCHKRLLPIIEAANGEGDAALAKFDKAIWGWIGDIISKLVRMPIHALTDGLFTRSPRPKGIGKFYRRLHAFAVAFSGIADIALATLGGDLKRKESLSARLGDVLSELYLAAATLKRFEDEGMKQADLPLVEHACRGALYRIQTKLGEVLDNLPNRFFAALLSVLAFPAGKRRKAPGDRIGRACAKLLLSRSEARDRLTSAISVNRRPDDRTGRIEIALEAAETLEAIETRIKAAKGKIKLALTEGALAQFAREGIIAAADVQTVLRARAAIRDAIAVDDFDPAELTRREVQDSDSPSRSRAVTG